MEKENKKQKLITKQKVNYNYGAYNKFDDAEQWIRITEGCPHNCPYCYEPQEIKIFKIPKIIRNKVKIMDMNLLCKSEVYRILDDLPLKVNGRFVEYELICGIDYRFWKPIYAMILKKKHFKKIRIAWDWFMKDQYKIKDVIEDLKKVGYKSNNIMIFIICNWRIPYFECCRKLDLCKVWNVQVADCYFDNQTSPNINPIHWNDAENIEFRFKCRKHNQLINFKIDPEIKNEI